jgi:hypothetical protein
MLALSLLALVLAGAPPPPSLYPWPIGVGPNYELQAAPETVLTGRPVGRLRCERQSERRFGVHLEVFAHRQVVIVPAGIGVARPSRRYFARVIPGGCTYAVRTLDPTGVLEVRAGARLTLGDVFRLWNQPLGLHRLAGFRTRGSVLAFVGGKRRYGDPSSIPLTRHAQIVLEIAGYVAPHPRYLFSGGL